MKALFMTDEVNQFHWSMLKSVMLILSLLPLSHFFLNLWQNTEGSSQIMVGFMAISVFSASAILSFCSALNATVKHFDLAEHMTRLESILVQVYRYIPMLSLMVMMSYLASRV